MRPPGAAGPPPEAAAADEAEAAADEVDARRRRSSACSSGSGEPADCAPARQKRGADGSEDVAAAAARSRATDAGRIASQSQ